MTELKIPWQPLRAHPALLTADINQDLGFLVDPRPVYKALIGLVGTSG